MSPQQPAATRRPGRAAAGIAIAGTVLIAGGAFGLSFVSLTHLATLAGLGPDRAWVWPLLVDGMIVVATVAVTTLHGPRQTAYAWALLFGGAAVSILANAVHAVLTSPPDVPVWISVLVASTPPLVLVAITHLTGQLLRAAARTDPPATVNPQVRATGTQVRPSRTARAIGAALPAAGQRQQAHSLRAAGRSNRAIALELSVHPSTVGRWLGPLPPPGSPAHLIGDQEPQGDSDERPVPDA